MLIDMKLFSVVPDTSLLSIVIIRYYGYRCNSLEMVKFRRFIRLLLHGTLSSSSNSRNYVNFSVFQFSFKLVLKDGLFYLYEVKYNKYYYKFGSSFPLLSSSNAGY